MPDVAVDKSTAQFRVWRDLAAYATTGYRDGQLEFPAHPLHNDRSDGRMSYLIEDLPIGTQCDLQLTGLGEQSLQETVTIDDEPAAIQTFEFTLPAASNP